MSFQDYMVLYAKFLEDKIISSACNNYHNHEELFNEFAINILNNMNRE